MSGPCIGDTTTVTLTATDVGLRADPVISTDAGNSLACTPSGLFVPAGPVAKPGVYYFYGDQAPISLAPPLPNPRTLVRLAIEQVYPGSGVVQPGSDTTGMYDGVDRVEVDEDGYYSGVAKFSWLSVTANGSYRFGGLRKNGSRVLACGWTFPNGAAATDPMVTVSFFAPLQVGDYVEAFYCCDGTQNTVAVEGSIVWEREL